MTRPSLVTYLIGNPVVVIGLWISTAVFGYRFWHGELNFIPALVAGGIASIATHASLKIQDFNRWNREWNAMNGKDGFRLPHIPGLRVVVLGGVWLCIAVYSIGHGGDNQATKLCSVFFWLGTLFVVLRGVYLLIRRIGGGTHRTHSDAPVALCLSSGRYTAELAQAYAALPTYCVSLVRQNG